MKSFLILYNEKHSEIFSNTLLKEHVSFLKNLKNLTICGPFIDNCRAILIIKAKSIDEVEHVINQDPFIINKYYTNYTINEFIEANEENNFLMT